MFTRTLFATLLVSVLILSGCDRRGEPIKADGPMSIGHYEFTPPSGWLYFHKEFPKKFTPSDFLVVSFFENEDLLPISIPSDYQATFFNFAVFMKKADTFDEYYKMAEENNVKFEELSGRTEVLNDLGDEWSCRYSYHNLHALECVTIVDNLVSVGVFGSIKDDVERRAPQLKELAESFKVKG